MGVTEAAEYVEYSLSKAELVSVMAADNLLLSLTERIIVASAWALGLAKVLFGKMSKETPTKSRQAPKKLFLMLKNLLFINTLNSGFFK